ncbi:MAG: hypothetical protein K1X29_10400 [Bdellovibrionales bacterium]|nr:hypothetical protein [Bdellovibrionales bacterium]
MSTKEYFSSKEQIISLLEKAPINIMFCDRSLIIQYMNSQSHETLKKIEAYLPIPVDKVVGSKIDIFHKDPKHQQQLLADPQHLPLHSIIQVGPEKLDLLVTAIYKGKKEYVGAMVTWDVVTEQLLVKDENARIKSMMENAPINIMCADINGIITYLNPKSKETLTKLQSHLNIPVDKIQGSSFDFFHKNPSHQRKLISDEKNLPLQSIIEVGNEKLELFVSAMRDVDGKYTGPMVVWDVVTEKLRTQNEMARIYSMMENAPINVMCADISGTITYLNPKSLETLKSIQKFLPVSVNSIKGSSFDVFHKNPSHQRQLIAEEKNLPYQAKISVGDQKLELYVSAMRDAGGKYIGPMVVWEVVTKKVNLLDTLTSQLGGSALNLSKTAQDMSANAKQTADSSKLATQNAETVSEGIKTVATNTEELVASIKEIARSTTEAATISRKALMQAKDANTIITKLGQASEEIGNVIKVISSIAHQTNLLALNATIEAARAGDAGKGFSVVANEVKELAKKTAQSTEEISQKIKSVQDSSQAAVTSIVEIAKVIDSISAIASSIATAVEEQTSVSNEVARIISASDQSVSTIVEAFRSVSKAAENSLTGASHTLESSQQMLALVDNVKELAQEI